MLFSCGEKEPEATVPVETLMTEYSDSLSIIMSRNGRRSYHFTTPLLEGYTLAREPYREFRKGVKITTYKDDSLTSVDAVLTANYAIYYEDRELWEAKGNVVVRKSDGKTLYTQQLFWNARTDKVYSNVDSKIVQNNGRDVFIGEGFESDASFKEWRFRRMKGRMEVEVKPRQDSTAVDASPASADAPRQPSRGGDVAVTPPAPELRQQPAARQTDPSAPSAPTDRPLPIETPRARVLPRRNAAVKQAEALPPSAPAKRSIVESETEK